MSKSRSWPPDRWDSAFERSRRLVEETEIACFRCWLSVGLHKALPLYMRCCRQELTLAERYQLVIMTQRLSDALLNILSYTWIRRRMPKPIVLPVLFAKKRCSAARQRRLLNYSSVILFDVHVFYRARQGQASQYIVQRDSTGHGYYFWSAPLFTCKMNGVFALFRVEHNVDSGTGLFSYSRTLIYHQSNDVGMINKKRTSSMYLKLHKMQYLIIL